MVGQTWDERRGEESAKMNFVCDAVEDRYEMHRLYSRHVKEGVLVDRVQMEGTGLV